MLKPAVRYLLIVHLDEFNLGRFLAEFVVRRSGDILHLAIAPNARGCSTGMLPIVPRLCSETLFHHSAARSWGNVVIKVFVLPVDLAQDSFEQRVKYGQHRFD